MDMLARLNRVICSIMIGFTSVAYAAGIQRQTVEATVQADGSVLFDGERIVGTNALEAKLLELATRKPSPILRLVQSKDVGYRTMYSFLETVQKVGLQINMTGNVAPNPGIRP